MAITVACDSCRHRYTVDSKFVGRMMTCKKCGTIFRIQKAATAAPAARPIIAEPEEDESMAAAESAAPAPPPIDPFENAQFEAPPKARPKAAAKKYYNPIETNALSPGEPEDAPAINRDAFAGKSGGGGGFNAISVYIILLVVATAVAFGVYWSIRISHATPVAATANSALSTLWTAVGIFLAAFFAFIAPLMLAGVWATFRAMKYPMVNSAYLRICGAAAPALLFAAAWKVGAIQSPLAWLLLLLLLPATYFLLKLMLDVDWAGAGVAFASGMVGFAFGFIILKVIVELMVPSDSPSPVRMAFYAPAPESPGNTVVDSPHQSPADSARTPMFAPAPPLASQDTAVNPVPVTGDQRIPPPPSIDPAIYSAAIDSTTPEWTTVVYLSGSKLGPEVSFKQFELRPPKEMRLDLQSSEESPAGLVWRGATNVNMRLSVYTQPRKNTRQLKPLVGDATLLPTTEQGLFVINRTGAKVSSGQINDILFTRIESAAEVQDESLTQYVAPFDGIWLIIEFSAPNHAPFARVMAAAAGTLRLTETGEQRADPLAAKVLAPRLAEDYEHVAPVLRNQGAAAEEAVLALLKSKDSQVRQAALRLLKDIATEKSVPALRRVAAESEPVVADLAREVLQRFQPPDVAPGPGVGVAPPGVGPPVAAPPGVVPPVAARPGVTPPASDKPGDFPTALADLDSNDIARRKAAVAALPSFSVEEAQRLPVMRKLLAMLRANDNTVPIPDVVAALAVWGNEKMIPDLLNLLKKDASPDARHAAMRVFANYKDQRAAVAVAGWIIIDPVPTADTLIAMGPAAEDAVIPYLRYEKNATARIDMARILSRIGTRKCLSELNVAAHDPKVPAAHDAALSAMEAVKARIQAETPGK